MRQTRILIVFCFVLLLLVLVDVVSTDIALRIPGLGEGNPYAMNILKECGILGLYFDGFFRSIALILVTFSIYYGSSKVVGFLVRRGELSDSSLKLATICISHFFPCLFYC